jgi:hypothetical protein
MVYCEIIKHSKVKLYFNFVQGWQREWAHAHTSSKGFDGEDPSRVLEQEGLKAPAAGKGDEHDLMVIDGDIDLVLNFEIKRTVDNKTTKDGE